MKKIILISSTASVIIVGVFIYFNFISNDTNIKSKNTDSNPSTAFTSEFICNTTAEWEHAPCTYRQDSLSDEQLKIMADEVRRELVAANNYDKTLIGNVIFSYPTDYGFVYQFGCDQDVPVVGIPGIPVAKATLCIYSSDFYYYFNANGSRIAVCTYHNSLNPKICSWLTSLKSQTNRNRVNVGWEPIQLTDVNNEYTLIDTERGVFKLGKSVTLPQDFPSDVYMGDGQIKSFLEDHQAEKYYIKIETTKTLNQLQQSYDIEFKKNNWTANTLKNDVGGWMEITAYKNQTSDMIKGKNIYAYIR